MTAKLVIEMLENASSISLGNFHYNLIFFQLKWFEKNESIKKAQFIDDV